MKGILSILILLVFVEFSFAQTDSITNKSLEYKTYTIAEVMPSWKGCETIENESQRSSCTYERIMNYLTGEIKYPESAKEKEVQGKVYVKFIIDETGKIVNPTILRGVSPELDVEAIRVVSGMPEWNPGMNKNIPVAVQYLLPIYFTLNQGNKY